jgi:hypothetical protein
MSALPTNFCYMNPEMRIYLDRAAYGDLNATPRVSNWNSSSAYSKATIISFEEVSDLSLTCAPPYQHTKPHL